MGAFFIIIVISLAGINSVDVHSCVSYLGEWSVLPEGWQYSQSESESKSSLLPPIASNFPVSNPLCPPHGFVLHYEVALPRVRGTNGYPVLQLALRRTCCGKTSSLNSYRTCQPKLQNVHLFGYTSH